MNLRPQVIEGSILDRPIDRSIVLKMVSNVPGGRGPPIKKRPPRIQPPEKPKDLGEERHFQLMGALKNLTVKQGAEQKVDQKANVTEALEQSRDWRR